MQDPGGETEDKGPMHIEEEGAQEAKEMGEERHPPGTLTETSQQGGGKTSREVRYSRYR